MHFSVLLLSLLASTTFVAAAAVPTQYYEVKDIELLLPIALTLTEHSLPERRQEACQQDYCVRQLGYCLKTCQSLGNGDWSVYISRASAIPRPSRALNVRWKVECTRFCLVWPCYPSVAKANRPEHSS